jgi:hypothetical protein
VKKTADEFDFSFPGDSGSSQTQVSDDPFSFDVKPTNAKPSAGLIDLMDQPAKLAADTFSFDTIDSGFNSFPTPAPSQALGGIVFDTPKPVQPVFFSNQFQSMSDPFAMPTAPTPAPKFEEFRQQETVVEQP